jgi:ketosteroid isomerase-like protein
VKIRAVNIAWFKAYNSGDGAAVAALYAEDAVLSAPGAPAARGNRARYLYP